MFKQKAKLFDRRQEKILTTVVSLFSSAYVFHLNSFFPNHSSSVITSFDGRIVLYPSLEDLKNYLNWR